MLPTTLTVALGLTFALYLLVAWALWRRAVAGIAEERRLLRYRPHRSLYVVLALLCLVAPLQVARTWAMECAQRARKWIAHQ